MFYFCLTGIHLLHVIAGTIILIVCWTNARDGLAAFWMRNDGLVGLSIGISTLAIAWFKGRLVVLDFMELRHAPLLWRALIEGWLLLVSGLILLFYFLGQNAV